MARLLDWFTRKPCDVGLCDMAGVPMKFRKLPVIIDAWQWHNHGDNVKVEYYNSSKPDLGCKKCDRDMYDHGWIDTLEGGHIVCPGDWIIKGIANEFYSCKPDIFAATYEKVEDFRSEEYINE